MIVLRQNELAEAAARPRGEKAYVVGDLHQRDGQGAQPGHRMDHRVERAERGEFVGRGDEGPAGEGGDLGGDPLAEFNRRVEPGADRRAAGSKPVEPVERRADAVHRVA
jgi:hypothetical protein